MKRCCRCKIEKHGSEFNRNKAKLDGLSSECKLCVKEIHKDYYKRNKDKVLEYQKTYNSNNVSKLKERNKRYRERNQDKYREYNNKYRECNPDKVRDSQKRYYNSNLEKERKRSNAYRTNNREKRKEICKRYRINNPEAVKAYKHKRRALERNVHDGTVTKQVIKTLLELTIQCPYCGTDLEDKAVHIDHIQPLAKGGLHTASNLVVCCEPCNLSKNSKQLEEYKPDSLLFYE